MNKAFLIGNLTRDPEVRMTQNGVSVCTFSLAVERRFSGQSTEKQTDFIPIVAWRQLADLCGKYLQQGRQVAVFGAIHTRSYDAKDGTKRYVTEIAADEIKFLSKPQQDGGMPQRTPEAASAGLDLSDLEGFSDVDGTDEVPF